LKVLVIFDLVIVDSSSDGNMELTVQAIPQAVNTGAVGTRDCPCRSQIAIDFWHLLHKIASSLDSVDRSV
jgi:hypothetical protein